MAMVKCPRCELNYINEDEGFCKICKREMKGEKHQEDIEICTVCNEAPALPGKDVCLFCLKEMHKNDEEEDEEEIAASPDEPNLDIDPVSTMDEIIPDIQEDIPDREYDEIDSDLSLDELGEEEAEDDEDDADDPDAN